MAATYDRDVKVVQFPPRLGLWLRQVHLPIDKRPRVPDVGQDALGLRAEPTVLTGEECDSAGLQQASGGEHFRTKEANFLCQRSCFRQTVELVEASYEVLDLTLQGFNRMSPGSPTPHRDGQAVSTAAAPVVMISQHTF